MTFRIRILVAALLVPIWAIATIAFTWFVGTWANPAWIAYALILLFFHWRGRWDVISTWLRWPALIAFVLITAVRIGWIPAAIAVAVELLLTAFVRRAPKRSSCVTLFFPFDSGTFYVAHGGSSSITNYHRNLSQRFAVDLTQLDVVGRRARGLQPVDNSEYRIFGTTLLSPCDGVVTAVRDGLPEQIPLEMDRQHVAGNHVVIRIADDLHVGLAHLQRGSVRVAAGDRVTAGQAIGKAGNSGHTSEPHLHIHAKRGGVATEMLDGVAVPIRFGGRWLVRNDVVMAPSMLRSVRST